MNGQQISSIDALESVVGRTPGAMHLKVIDHLDAGALRWIAAAPLVCAGFGDASRLGVTFGGGRPGFAGGDARSLRMPTASLDDPDLARPGAAFGSLFLIPGIGETLRVNGRVEQAGAEEIQVSVEECYGHCAKAVIRSELWAAQPVDAVPGDPAGFIAASRFAALATLGAEGHADLSPKGDPAGCMAQLDGDTLWFADRPGNRRCDSLRNILGRPDVALALLIPGAAQLAVLRGQAALTTEPAARARFEVRGKVPSLAIRVAVSGIEYQVSPALARAGLWPVAPAAQAIDPAALFVEHIKLNRGNGLGARLASAALAVPGAATLLKKGLDKDYKENLY
ncbi:pyridoxamine 5'-phosphate oxidase family protein [Siccirubricoccus phaeus]|uniref:pyridoxamine 5'-phosphate oxidase family protein n=1 Tax=Siccirubricoccus phaeus TaxID=2595053 RepID=UPI0011F3CD72|nr:pyridoxamine 5'-phosphate oxidase family protein [Siccirubricoccus phaeus]